MLTTYPPTQLQPPLLCIFLYVFAVIGTKFKKTIVIFELDQIHANKEPITTYNFFACTRKFFSIQMNLI